MVKKSKKKYNNLKKLIIILIFAGIITGIVFLVIYIKNTGAKKGKKENGETGNPDILSTLLNTEIDKFDQSIEKLKKMTVQQMIDEQQNDEHIEIISYSKLNENFTDDDMDYLLNKIKNKPIKNLSLRLIKIDKKALEKLTDALVNNQSIITEGIVILNDARDYDVNGDITSSPLYPNINDTTAMYFKKVLEQNTQLIGIFLGGETAEMVTFTSKEIGEELQQTWKNNPNTSILYFDISYGQE